MTQNIIRHYGTPRHSGRYPWGSGKNPYQSLDSFSSAVKKLEGEGFTQVEIAKSMGMSTTELRARKRIAKNERRKAEEAEAWRLKNEGMSNVKIGEVMGKNESYIRTLLKPSENQRKDILTTTANLLQDKVNSGLYLDVGEGVELQLGISKETLNTAVQMLKDQGYKVHHYKQEQLGSPGQFTSVKVLGPIDSDYKNDFLPNVGNIEVIGAYSEDGGRSYLGIEPIVPVDRDRVMVRYAEDGGVDKDGVIELRRGVDDLSLGGNAYAQVRIGVGKDGYMKGMAMYGERFPKGVDIIYNTNKSRGSSDDAVFKTIEDDPDNPFGSIVRQHKYVDSDGKSQLSPINIIGYKGKEYVEGAWNKWSKTLSSQFLSKQPVALAERQLNRDLDTRKADYDEIMELTNPAVKKKFLMSFADECDSAATHLKAAAMPRQQNRVILPLPNMPEDKIYAPSFNDGERVVLIRHPHAGRFEIPELTVDNKNPQARKILGPNPNDAVGIHPNVAKRLSGADFDGDSVLVIPNNDRRIKTSPPLAGLKNFEPHIEYAYYDGMQVMTKAGLGKQMGDISNLITDMTIKGAPDHELEPAVKHSMVVIDAPKHKLNYKQSAIDNNIKQLKEKYQLRADGGAATLISRARATNRVPQRIPRRYKDHPDGPYDSKTGEKVFVETGETYNKKSPIKSDPNRTIVTPVSTKISGMDSVKDARQLMSGPNHEGTEIETAYANYANTLKGMANQARLEWINTPGVSYSPSARKTYQRERDTLDSKLRIAKMNAPLERKANVAAGVVVRAKVEATPSLKTDKKALKKLKYQALTEQRERLGAKKQTILISDREWEAIQAGAISNNMLEDILRNVNEDRIRELATPRSKPLMDAAAISRAKAMLNRGLSQAEVASALGVSVTTLINNI